MRALAILVKMLTATSAVLFFVLVVMFLENGPTSSIGEREWAGIQNSVWLGGDATMRSLGMSI